MFKVKETVTAVRELPSQIKATMQMAFVAMCLAIASIIISVMGGRNAN